MYAGTQVTTESGPAPFDHLSDDDLLALWGNVMVELRRRGIVESGNSPVADRAEKLVAAYYGATPAPPNTPAYDLVVDGHPVQVKGLRRTGPSRGNLGAIRSLDFDLLVAVAFNPDMSVEGAWRMPRATVEKYARWNGHVNGYVLRLSKKLLSDESVEQLDLRSADRRGGSGR
jgi:hypothetical protein